MSASHKPQVKTVVFDLGKVLLDFDYGRAALALAQRSTSTPAQVRELIDQSPLLLEFESGALNTSEFIAAVSNRIGFHGGPGQFIPSFANIFTPIPEMIALAARFQREGMPTCIFSNTNPIAVEHIRATHPFFGAFTHHVLSYQEHGMKPDAPVYRVVEERTGHSAGQLLYIDDRLENVLAARERGWVAIHHVTARTTLDTVASVLG